MVEENECFHPVQIGFPGADGLVSDLSEILGAVTVALLSWLGRHRSPAAFVVADGVQSSGGQAVVVFSHSPSCHLSWRVEKSDHAHNTMPTMR